MTEGTTAAPRDKLGWAGLSGNGLKLIALAAMTIDHVGSVFFPEVQALRILGRVAFPLFAFMIGEGCRYTRNRRRYQGLIWGLALVCQTAYSIFSGDLYLCVLVTFGLSIPTTLALRDWRTGPGWWNKRLLHLALLLAGDGLVCLLLPRLLAPWGFQVDYGLWGVLFPVLLACRDDKAGQLLLATVGLVLLGWSMGGVQWACLMALPLLALYNGSRGRWKLKNLFYVYYPAHLVVLQGIALLL